MYPVSYQADVQVEGRNRLTVGLRYFWAIPIMIVAFIYGIGAYLGTFVAWFSLMFTGKYPEGIYDFNVKAMRVFARAGGYYYLLTDVSPPLNGDADDGYPVRVAVGPAQGSYDRIKVFFRGLLLIPVYIVAGLYGFGLSIVTFIAWVTIVFTGSYPEGMASFARNASAYNARAIAFMFLMTDEFPPVSEEPVVVPATPAA